jgi:hypothetical protein
VVRDSLAILLSRQCQSFTDLCEGSSRLANNDFVAVWTNGHAVCVKAGLLAANRAAGNLNIGVAVWHPGASALARSALRLSFFKFAARQSAS